MYNRGFLLTSEDINVNGWKKEKLKNLTAWIATDLTYYKFMDDNVSVLLLGKVVDPFNNIGDGEIIVKSLAKKIVRSNDNFFDYLDDLSGRFVVLVEHGEEMYILQDATGNKSLFYDEDYKYFSSHAEMIGDYTSKNKWEVSDEYISDPSYHREGKHFPGVLTTYSNIKKAIPNTLIDVNRNEIKRFFPREPLSERKIDAALVDEISYLLENQMNLLNENNDLAISLTAGLDSRVTLAVSKNLKQKIFYYTINSEKLHEKEIEVVKELSKTFDFEHHVLTENGSAGDSFIEQFLKNTSYMSSKERGMLAKILVEMYPEDKLHIKSNVSEVGRAFYHENRAFLPSMPNAEYLAKLYKYNSKSDFVINAFKELIEITDFNKESIYNYNPYDLHYWEYRMGSWQSIGLMECDVAQDSFVLFNSRRILKLMLSVPFKDRRNSTLHYKVIEKMWSELLDIPINPWVAESKTKEVKRLVRGLMYRIS